MPPIALWWPADVKKNPNSDQSILEEQSILLSGPYGDDVAFMKQFNDQIIIGKIKLEYSIFKKYLFKIKKNGLSYGISGNRHHGFDQGRREELRAGGGYFQKWEKDVI